MIKIEQMMQEENDALLARVGFGHLGCSRDGHPYVVPMHYAYDGVSLYFFTTEGTKTEFISANHEVCFQVEEIDEATHWQSVMVTGRAVRLHDSGDIERAMQFVTKQNPALAPALNRTKIGAWARPSSTVLYRVRPEASYGRRATPNPEAAAAKTIEDE